MHPRDIILLTILMAIWGSSFTAVKLSLPVIPPFTLAAVSLLLTCLYLLPWIKRPQALRPLLLAGSLNGLRLLPMFYGMQTAGAGVTGVLFVAETALAVLIGVFFFNEPLRRWRLCGTGLAILGLLLVFGLPPPDSDRMGMMWIMLGVLMSTIATGFSKQAGQSNNGMAMAFWQSLIGSLWLVVIAVIWESALWPDFAAIRLLDVYTVFHRGVLAGALGLGVIWYPLLQRYQLNQIMPFMVLSPLFAVMVSAVVLGETITIAFAAGTVLALLGLTIIVRDRIPPKTL